MWQVFLLRLMIVGYRFDMLMIVRFTWYTFGGMDSWMGLALVVGAISAMDI